jgi:hydroxymethylbilane synthase
LISEDCLLDELDDDATVIANDVRAASQLRFYRPDLHLIRSPGSLDSIIQKVQGGKAQAAILAAGDVERLHKQDYVTEFLTCSVSVPAAGQGALAVLVRSDEEAAKKSMRAINEPAAYSEIAAERAFLHYLGVHEEAPVGVLGAIEGKVLELEGMIALPDGRERIREVVTGTVGREADLGEQLAREILDAGGQGILQELNLL